MNACVGRRHRQNLCCAFCELQHGIAAQGDWNQEALTLIPEAFSNDYQIISLAEEDLPSVFGFLEVAFRHKDFIVNGEAVPISRYLSDDSMNY